MLPIAPDTVLQQRYRILNLLGEEEVGRTYIAADTSRADAYCAIEEIVPSTQFPTIVAKAKELFKQEVTRLYQLQHLQLPRFWTVFEEQDRLFLVRDYIAGKTYGHLLAERRDAGTTFTESEVWRFLVQILPVVGYIHSKGIIHRDLSPDRIIRRERDGLPVPIDFGIVTEFATKLAANPDHQSAGTPGYVPPEQLQNAQAVYPHSDLYALAVTAIVLLTGKEPSALFVGEAIDWDWRKWMPIGDDFANVLSRMLSPQPGDRYQSALEVDRDLQAIGMPDLRSADPAHRPSTLPTVAVGKAADLPSATAQTAITHLSHKSMWEKPQVFIPLGVLISLLAGFGSWFGVSQLLHRQPDAEPVATTPPKQIDFNNPTIPDDPNSADGDVLRPELNRPIFKQGTVDPNTPIRFRVAAIAGQNLDIQLVSATSQTVDPIATTPPTDPTKPLPSPSATTTPTPSRTKDPKANNVPISVPSPIAATQVLMTILSPTGTPIDDRADRVVAWRGQVSESGDYTIELRPIAGLAGNTFPYRLSITQIAVAPSPAPTPIDPSSPSTGSTPPLGIPIPIGGTGINSIPANPNTNQPNNNSLPTVSPTPVPIDVPATIPPSTPTQSERPNRNRRRNRTESQIENRQRVESSEETPTRRRRRRVESTPEETPAPRRRRQVESNNEQTPTPRRRSRQNNPDVQPSPSPSFEPDANNNLLDLTPKSEPVKTPAPTESATPQPTKPDSDVTAPPVGSEKIDPE